MTQAAPLLGIRVLDLTRLLPGPYCTQLLVDLGAEVIKVEDPHGGDYLRYTPPLLDDGQSVLFWVLNRGKKSLRIDLKDARGRGHFLALVRSADVVVESFRPGVMEKLELTWETLKRENPRVVFARISGYGQHGADRLRAGHDVNYLAKAGVLALVRAPELLPVQVADLAAGALPAALEICAALVGRARTGTGALIDVSMAHQAYNLATTTLACIAAGDDVEGGAHLLCGGVPSYDVYATADGFISVGALEPKFWFGLCDALQLPALKDRGFQRGVDGDEVRALLRATFSARSTDAWSEFFAHRDLCVEVVRPASAVVADPTFSHVTVDVAGRPLTLPVPAPAMVGACASSLPAPQLGAHDAEFAHLLTSASLS